MWDVEIRSPGCGRKMAAYDRRTGGMGQGESCGIGGLLNRKGGITVVAGEVLGKIGRKRGCIGSIRRIS